ncbi:MAG: metal-sulfur cluster assembly factor [Anaerolineae bacterium]|nr:metal-sulfur cluster assembly factor [Anaerolineae bacterium]
MSDMPNNGAAAPSDTPKSIVSEETVREALRQVIDPEIGMDVIMLGLIRELDLQPDKSHVVMMLTTPFCPYGPQMLEQTRRVVQEVTGVPTTIEMSMELWEPSMMEEGAAQDWGLFY